MNLSPQNILFLFAVGSAMMAAMATAIIFIVSYYQKKNFQNALSKKQMEMDYQQRMLKLELEGQENERKRIAKDLHDGVGVMIQALRMTTLSITKGAAEEDRKEVQEMVNELTETIRRISWDLMPSSLERFGLFDAVDEMCNRLSNRSTVPVRFFREGSTGALEKDQEILLYRIVQESVNNALKHALASAIDVLFKLYDHQLILLIKDDGIGFERLAKSDHIALQHGIGLFSLENRATLLRAKLSIQKNIPTGTVVSVSLPINIYG